MIVLYLKENNQFHQAISGFPEIKEEANKLLFANGRIIINDLTKAGYSIYPDQKVNVPMRWDEELEGPIEIPVTVNELNLRDFEVQDLPTSQHLARIKSIDVSKAKPVTITREFAGKEFGIPAVATESVKDQFLAGDIKVGDIVIVTYCEKRIDDAIVTAKVYKSW